MEKDCPWTVTVPITTRPLEIVTPDPVPLMFPTPIPEPPSTVKVLVTVSCPRIVASPLSSNAEPGDVVRMPTLPPPSCKITDIVLVPSWYPRMLVGNDVPPPKITVFWVSVLMLMTPNCMVCVAPAVPSVKDKLPVPPKDGPAPITTEVVTFPPLGVVKVPAKTPYFAVKEEAFNPPVTPSMMMVYVAKVRDDPATPIYPERFSKAVPVGVDSVMAWYGGFVAHACVYPRSRSAATVIFLMG